MLLKNLALKHKTDKYNWGYMEHYSRYFPESKRHEVKKVLEIGVKGGASLRMWREYFPNAHIFGMDINPRCANPEGCTVFIGDQSEVEDLEKFKKLHSQGGDLFDFIVDDGGHSTKQQITSFKFLWERIRPGGVYVIEDLVTQYAGNKLTKSYHLDIPNQTTMKYLYEIIDNINSEKFFLNSSVYRMEFTKWQCFIVKEG